VLHKKKQSTRETKGEEDCDQSNEIYVGCQVSVTKGGKVRDLHKAKNGANACMQTAEKKTPARLLGLGGGLFGRSLNRNGGVPQETTASIASDKA